MFEDNSIIAKLILSYFIIYFFNSTRLLELFAPIFYFICKHFLFKYIVKQNKKNKFADFKNKNFVDFQNFQKPNFVRGIPFEDTIAHEPSLGSREVSPKSWARSIQPFWRSLDTNKQTNLNKPTPRQAKFIYRWVWPPI